MKYTLFVIGAIVALFFLVIVMVGISYFGFVKMANGYEADIQAAYTNNQNVYDNNFKAVMEMAQVPQMQVDGIKQVYDAVMKGRYGANGSQAVVQLIKEQNPNLDPKLYEAIQRKIDEFHREFQANQTGLISKKQEYQRYLKSTTSGLIFNNFANYPHIDLSKYDIVTSDQTQKAFDTKKAGVLQINPAAK